MRTAAEEANLKHVLEMFHQVLVPLDSTKVDQYISPDYIQHSQMAAPGVDSLKAFLDARRGDSPDATQEMKRAFVDGDHVILHYHVRRFKGDPGFAVMDIFRVADGLIVEHWDCVQEVPTDSPNPNSMF
ncbi:MAG: nuclear transport factor 2 family protein [Gammaproteobacteria bacterium]|nr:nuclear transport factor 2 family protein [Gammaproteobacteria bacterium]